MAQGADDGARRARAVVRHARWAAAATAAGMAAHLAMAADGGWMAALAVAMAAGCGPCAWGLWRRPTVRGARMLVGMSLAMALVHAALVLGAAPAGPSGTGHVHARTVSAAGADHTGHLGPALGAVAADFAAALLAASWLRRVARRGESWSN